jgi:hypothetical protein
VIKSLGFVKAVLDDLIRFNDAFATLIASPEFTPECAEVPDTLLGDSLTDLSVSDFLTNTNVHRSEPVEHSELF